MAQTAILRVRTPQPWPSRQERQQSDLFTLVMALAHNDAPSWCISHLLSISDCQKGKACTYRQTRLFQHTIPQLHDSGWRAHVWDKKTSSLYKTQTSTFEKPAKYMTAQTCKLHNLVFNLLTKCQHTQRTVNLDFWAEGQVIMACLLHLILEIGWKANTESGSVQSSMSKGRAGERETEKEQETELGYFSSYTGIVDQHHFQPLTPILWLRPLPPAPNPYWSTHQQIHWVMPYTPVHHSCAHLLVQNPFLPLWVCWLTLPPSSLPLPDHSQ